MLLEDSLSLHSVRYKSHMEYNGTESETLKGQTSEYIPEVRLCVVLHFVMLFFGRYAENVVHCLECYAMGKVRKPH